MSLFIGLQAVLVSAGLASLAFTDQGSPLTAPAPSSMHWGPRIYKAERLRTLEHFGKPFTQGLEYTPDHKFLVETSGDYPPGTGSFVRLLDPTTGEEVQRITEGLAARDFAEGITLGDNGHWYMSTFLNHVVLEYNKDWEVVGHHPFGTAGWGLSRGVGGAPHFLATNGTQWLMTVDPETFEMSKVKRITCLGEGIIGLNELEMIQDFKGQGPVLMGNVYESRLVLLIDPKTAECTGLFHLEGFGVTGPDEAMGYHVANGIAYNNVTDTFMVTGKNWEQMFEIKLVDADEGAAGFDPVNALETYIHSHPSSTADAESRAAAMLEGLGQRFENARKKAENAQKKAKIALAARRGTKKRVNEKLALRGGKA